MHRRFTFPLLAGLVLTTAVGSFAATTSTTPKAPDVGKAATEYVDQMKQTPVCTLEGDSAASYSCTTLAFGTPFTFRCVTTATSTVCAVPLPPEGTAGEVVPATPTVSDAPTGK
jgi:hypothetical protein